jgi:hypothetical protein
MHNTFKEMYKICKKIGLFFKMHISMSIRGIASQRISLCVSTMPMNLPPLGGDHPLIWCVLVSTASASAPTPSGIGKKKILKIKEYSISMQIPKYLTQSF